jgi:triosephosphate isomerase
MPRRPLVAGNWKMNLTLLRAEALAKDVAEGATRHAAVDVAIFPPLAYLPAVVAAAGGDGAPISIGAQDLHPDRSGAYTGEVAGHMIREVGGTMVLCGHSERRQLFGESPTYVGAKVAAAVRDGLVPVLCVGETLEEREAGTTEAVVKEQLDAGLGELLSAQVAEIVIAYEPVWAIGTGRHATPEQAGAVHAFIRRWLRDHIGEEGAEEVRILYGGSVKPDNAGDLMAQPDIDGALVGGASLEARSFLDILRAATR